LKGHADADDLLCLALVVGNPLGGGARASMVKRTF
jgi:hypothetical protein